MRTPHWCLIGATVAAVAASVVLAGTGRAFAHIDPDPPQAPAASTQSVGFTVEHGCDGSPTVQLDTRLPDGVSNATAEPLDGWSSTITDNVLTFTGGPLPNDAAMTFRILMTLPDPPGKTLYFPFVQRCDTGEIPWLELPIGNVEPEQPAPTMLLTAAVAAPPPPPTAPATVAVAAATTAPATTAQPATTPPPTTAATTEPAPTTAPSDMPTIVGATGATGAVDSGTGSVVFFAVVAVIVALGALVIRQVRRAR